MKTLLLLTLLFMQNLSSAAIFQCKIDGRMVFSQQPCGDNAKELEIKTAPRMIKDNKSSVVEANERVEKYGAKLETSRLKRQYKREIKNNKKTIRELKQQKSEKLAETNAIKRHSRSIYSPSEFNKIKSLSIHKTKTEYNTKINKAKRAIRALNKNLKGLN